jgi:hypothetical protein
MYEALSSISSTNKKLREGGKKGKKKKGREEGILTIKPLNLLILLDLDSIFIAK